MPFFCTKSKFFILIFINIFTIILYVYNTTTDYSKFVSNGQELIRILKDTKSPKISTDSTFTSKCECRKSDVTSIEQNGSEYVVQTKYRDYKMSDTDVQSIMCDAYNVLRRGPNQKVIGFSLWGNEERYVALLKEVVSQVKQFYPDWTMRVYHDSSISPIVQCELECLKAPDGSFMNNVDFCDIESIGYGRRVWSAKDIQNEMWRFMPIGESFVDAFMSRDSDSLILRREKDSVDVWLQSNKVGHIMRDHKDHGAVMLAGMWGFYNSRSRDLANNIFRNINDTKLRAQYFGRKGNDQAFLSNYVYRQIKDNSVIHDSNLCRMYRDSEPFPTRRVGYCHVGLRNENCANESKDVSRCPVECRPKDHQDWEKC